jgi:hypothetical protein
MGGKILDRSSICFRALKDGMYRRDRDLLIVGVAPGVSFEAQFARTGTYIASSNGYDGFASSGTDFRSPLS